MCTPTTKVGVSESAQAAHEAMLALHDVHAKYNASIRVKYPPSAPAAQVMERNTSAWVNDAPFLIQESKHAAEDAICAKQAEDGVNEILEAAHEWACFTPIDEKGREI